MTPSGTDDDSGAGQLGFELTPSPWPDTHRFPHNRGRPTVGDTLLEDLREAFEPLVITGYGGLEQLLELLAGWERRRAAGRSPRRIRVIVGTEPTIGGLPSSEPLTTIQGEIAGYWLERGISLLQSAQLLAAISLVESGLIAVRTSGAGRIHAKIYATEDAATLGSSNFTRPGLTTNVEANARFQRDDDRARYDETVTLAERIWEEARDFTDGFRALLEQLIRKVTWEEALARACSEILDRADIPRSEGTAVTLWPSQEQGIGEALWILENSGAVLVADATGSGKTRAGAHLLAALQSRIWRTGQSRARQPVLICPPALQQAWRDELARAGEAAAVFSHGMLGRSQSRREAELTAALRGADILVIDEAHNFLNRLSNRARRLLGSTAAHVVLLTATPINRGVSDLAAIVDLLGADNFDDPTLRVLSGLTGRRSDGVTRQDADLVRETLRRFVVRRTKSDFNRLIDREPARYLNAAGDQCRFPEHVPVVFDRPIDAADDEAARAVQAACTRLKGLVNLRKPLRLPPPMRRQGVTPEQFARMRLGGAAALASYHVRSRLRSSRAALLEHLVGTRAALEAFGITGSKAGHSGNTLAVLARIRGRPPRVELDAEVPEWLLDPAAHADAVDAEIEAYEEIRRHAARLTDTREEANADYLRALLRTHERVLAFDSHPISLLDIHERLRRRGVDAALATGEKSMSARLAFSRRFGLRAAEAGLGLCSDALAEGLNLQGASAIVHLDMPTVVRVLEQRIGRVDRMDSPHASIEVHWPREPDAFQMRSDERLFMRLRDVEELIGSNVPVPEALEPERARTEHAMSVEEVIDEVERSAASGGRVSLSDAFERVRSLVESPDALVRPEIYASVRESGARVLSSVSVVRADAPWVFVAVGASDRSVPRWVLVDGAALADRPTPGGSGRSGSPSPRIETALDRVADELDRRLRQERADLPFDDRAASLLAGAVGVLEAHRARLVPRRKRRALDELHHVVRGWAEQARKNGDGERVAVTQEILGLLDRSGTTVDLVSLADWWIRLVRDEWYEHLTGPKVRRPARLRDIRRKLRDHPIDTERLATVRDLELALVPFERRIVAAIVGVAEA